MLTIFDLTDVAAHYPIPVFAVLTPVVLITVLGLVMVFSWLSKRQNMDSDQSKKLAVHEDGIPKAEVDYTDLQRGLGVGLQNLDDAWSNLQTLFSSVEGAKALYQEVDSHVTSLAADDLESTKSLEVVVADLEKLLVQEAQNRWALLVSRDNEIKAISNKCNVFKTALDSMRTERSQEMDMQKLVFEKTLAEKEDDIKFHQSISSDLHRALALKESEIESNATAHIGIVQSLKEDIAEKLKSELAKQSGYEHKLSLLRLETKSLTSSLEAARTELQKELREHEHNLSLARSETNTLALSLKLAHTDSEQTIQAAITELGEHKAEYARAVSDHGAREQDLQAENAGLRTLLENVSIENEHTLSLLRSETESLTSTLELVRTDSKATLQTAIAELKSQHDRAISEHRAREQDLQRDNVDLRVQLDQEQQALKTALLTFHGAEADEKHQTEIAEAVQKSVAILTMTKDAELDASRLDFQAKLATANAAIDSQSKTFDQRLRAELEAQETCFNKRLDLATTIKDELQKELQLYRSQVATLQAQVKITQFKANGAGVLLETQASSAAPGKEKSRPATVQSNGTGGVLACTKFVPSAFLTRQASRIKENLSNNNAPAQTGDVPTFDITNCRRSRHSRRRDGQGYTYWKSSDFQFLSELGKGKLGAIHLAVEQKTMTEFAIKKVSRRSLSKSKLPEDLMTRIEMMGQLNHPGLQRMLGSFEDRRWIYIVFEYFPNGIKLLDHQQRLLRDKILYPPSDVAILISALAKPLEYIHKQGFIHCQVSLHKVLLSSSGVARLAGPTVGLASMPIPPPECLDEPPRITFAVDSWGLGVLAFTLLVGRMPFTSKDNVVDHELVATGSPVFSSQTDPESKAFILSLLEKDPSKRLRMSDVLVHPFIVQYEQKVLLPLTEQ